MLQCRLSLLLLQTTFNEMKVQLDRPPRRESDRTASQRGIFPGPSVWLGMGGRGSPLLPSAPSPVLVLIVILGVCIKSALTCETDICWRNFQVAEAELNPESKDRSGNIDRCISLRTYHQCLEGLYRCKGDINYHSIKKVIRNQMNQNNCDAIGPTYMPQTNITPLPPPDAVCSFQGKKTYRHCGLFGDPHIRTFSKEFQTCKVEGAWPLVNNEHLIVQVTNEPVSNSIGATATTKLTVLIKRNKECAENRYHMYRAETGYLPGAFDDGQVSYGHSRSVELREVNPGKHVEIYIWYIDTKILVRQVGAYLTFAIRMPEELINSSRDDLELCVRGCPKTEIINYQKFLATKEQEVNGKTVMSRKQAEETCRNAGLVDFYFDSCVFDLMTTGSENFTVAAFSALEDLLRLVPDIRKDQENRTTLDKYDAQYGGVGSVRTTLLESVTILLLTLLTCFLIKFETS